MKFLKLCGVLFLLSAFATLSACQNTNTPATDEPNTADEADTANETDASAGGDQIITVGTTGTYFPYSYVDDDGNLTGYDVEAVRLLDEKIDGITVEFATGPLETLFLEMDAGRYNMVANQIARNPEREEKYLFAEDGYIFVQSKLAVNGDDNENTKLEDMTGKIMGGLTTDYFTDLMRTYNEEHGNPYEMQYYDEYTSVFQELSFGRIDGTINDVTVVGGYAETYGLNIKTVGEFIEESFSYFCIRKDETGQAFKTKLDAALTEALGDGSLAALSTEWFGGDFTTNRDE